MVEALGHGRFAVMRAGSRDPGSGIRQVQIAYAVRERDRVWVFIDGHTYVIEGDRDDRERVHATDDRMALSSPMPATVVAIKATPGQEVAEGDLLVMLEAMKMELPIRAPRDGRIKSIGCREGDLVQPGIALLEFE